MNEPSLQSFLEMLSAEQGASEHTIEAYQRDILDFFVFLHMQQKKRSAFKATTEDIRHYLVHLHQRQLANTTCARKLSSLKHYYRFLAAEDYIAHNPAETIDAPKRSHALPKYLAEDDVYTLLSQTDDHRLHALLETLYASGLRVSELVSLQLSHLQFEQKTPSFKLKPYLIIKGKGRKERLAPLNERAVLALETHLLHLDYNDKTPAKHYVFPSRGASGHLTRQRFGQMLKTHAYYCGIDPQLVSPHILRHSFASHMLHNGLNLRVLQELLGHSNISTTQIYTHIMNHHMQKLVEEKHPLAQKT